MNPEEYMQIAFLKHLTFSFSIGCRQDIAQQASEVNQQNDMFSAVKAFNESASVTKKEDTIFFYFIFILFYEQSCAMK